MMKLATRSAFLKASPNATSLDDVGQLRLRLAAITEENAALRETLAKAQRFPATHAHDLAGMQARHEGVGLTENLDGSERFAARITDFHVLAESLPQIVWITDGDGRNIFFNQRWAEYTGLTLDESHGDGWNTPFHPDCRQRAWAAWRNAVVNHGEYSLSCRLRRADGAYRWWLIRGAPQLDGSGSIERWFGTCTDIHDLNVAKADAETLILANDVLVTSEAALVSLLASSREETSLGRSDLLETMVALAMSRKETRIGQTDLVASELANKILSEDYDLLATSEATLERLVEERTAALIHEVEERRRAEETLRHGEKMRAIGQITGGIAHDFNNLLQVFMTGVGLLRRPTLSDGIRASVLDGMDFAVESAAALVSRLLTFARKQALRPEVFDLNTRVAHICELLNATLGASISLQTDCASDLWPAVADPNQLDIAILNLAVNARDAMLPDGGSVILRTCNVSLEATIERPAGDYVRLAVEDSGSGMSPAVLARVFEPFFTTKPEGKGTGLGLAQVYGFARQSGGDVAIESAPGKGTIVMIHLPRPTVEMLLEEAREKEKMATQIIQKTGRTVLVVEDNADLAHLTASMLEELGYLTKCALNATEALALLESGESIDGVFSDVSMPGPINGLRLASALRRLYPQIAVVLATGYSQSLVEREDAAEAEVLSKPYRRHDLDAAMQRAFAAVEQTRRANPGITRAHR